MNYNHTISTGCCLESNKHKVVFLLFPYERMDSEDESYVNKKPKWVARGFESDELFGGSLGVMMEVTTEVKHCPFCTKKVPNIELNEDVIDFYKIHDSEDGNYCITCNERNMACKCLAPQFRWKPVGRYVEIPKNSIKKN